MLSADYDGRYSPTIYHTLGPYVVGYHTKSCMILSYLGIFRSCVMF